jgi:type III secretion protein S
MELTTMGAYVKQALLLVLLLSMPVVISVGVVGLVVAFLQAVTQVQDQTIAFGIKLVVAIATLAFMSGWLGSEMFTFADSLFAAIASVK